MRILPPKTLPSSTITYRHTPAEGAYSTYRNCLRWEFGFTCPFCLIHEADFLRTGQADGFGLTSIEHILPQSEDESAKNIYTNCVYCCRMCNRSRSNKKQTDSSGRQLLNPTSHAWQQHFLATNDDRILPIPGDRDAEYTHQAYELDDPRKQTLRNLRRRLIEDHLDFIKSDPMKKVIRLLELAENQAQVSDVTVLVETANDLRKKLRLAIDQLGTYIAIPPDAPTVCRCHEKSNHNLPAAILDQTIELL